MKRSRFSEEQIIGILKEHETGVPADLCRKHGVSDASIYKLKVKFGHAGQCGAEGSLGKEMVTPERKRRAVAHLVETHGMSERRASKAISCCRMTMRYRTTRADDAVLRQRMKASPRTPALRLSATACPAQAGGLPDQQEAVPALSGREAGGTPGVAAVSGPSEPGRRCWFRRCPTTAGRSTSCRINSPTAAASAS
jgi:putative transposase